MALLQIVGNRRNAVQYEIGNPLTASKMTHHQLPAALYAPLRVVLFEDEHGRGIFEYDRPSSFFSQYGDECVTEVGRYLDATLEAALRNAADQRWRVARASGSAAAIGPRREIFLNRGINSLMCNATKLTTEWQRWVKSYRPIEPIALPDVGCCSKTGHGFASQRNVAKGQETTFDRCSTQRLASRMCARVVRDLFNQITQNAQSAIQQGPGPFAPGGAPVVGQ
jgi:hypothetical protein